MAEVFRIVKNRNFTVMGNYHLKERGLSFKAKGLLSYMLSLPDDWDYTMDGLAGTSADGLSSVRSALKELEDFGYLERPGQVRDERGHFRKAVYVIHEEPITVGGKSEGSGDGAVADAALDDGVTVCENPTPDTYCEGAGSLENSENQDNDDAEPVCENPISENPTSGGRFMVQPSSDLPMLENQISGEPICENPISGNRTQPNTNILNTNNINTNILNQGEPAASPGNNGRGMYFPESKELSDAFRDFVHMRRRKGGGSMTDRAIALTKDWIRRESVRDGRFEVDIAIDILNYSTMNGFSKLYTLEERQRQLKPNRRDLSEKSPSYEGKSDEELEESLLAN